MTTSQKSKPILLAKALLWMGAGVVGMAALFFLPAGTLHYWQAWVLLGVLTISTLVLCVYLLITDPQTLQRRMKHKERDPQQNKLINFSGIFLSLVFLLPGLDRRLGWSHLPVWVVILGDGMALTGFLLFSLVLRENRFASRVIEVEQGQQVISSGPYALVRHPMYVSMLLVYLSFPLALGSLWALIPALAMIPILGVRIINEEKMLALDLPGYNEYLQKVKYRLLPGIW